MQEDQNSDQVESSPVSTPTNQDYQAVEEMEKKKREEKEKTAEEKLKTDLQDCKNKADENSKGKADYQKCIQLLKDAESEQRKLMEGQKANSESQRRYDFILQKTDEFNERNFKENIQPVIDEAEARVKVAQAEADHRQLAAEQKQRELNEHLKNLEKAKITLSQNGTPDFSKSKLNIAELKNPDSPISRALGMFSPDLREKLVDPNRRAIQIGDTIIPPIQKSDSELRMISKEDYGKQVQYLLKVFQNNTKDFLKYSAEAQSYSDSMRGRLWEVFGGDRGETPAEVNRDGSLVLMVRAGGFLRDQLGVSGELNNRLQTAIQSAINKDSENVKANYEWMTRNQILIPAIAFAAPVAMFVAAPALVGGSFTVTGTGLSTIGVKGVAVASGLGLGVGGVANTIDQAGAIYDGKQEGLNALPIIKSAGVGAVAGPIVAVVPPLGAALGGGTIADQLVEAGFNFKNGNYGGATANVVNGVMVPLALKGLEILVPKVAPARASESATPTSAPNRTENLIPAPIRGAEPVTNPAPSSTQSAAPTRIAENSTIPAPTRPTEPATTNPTPTQPQSRGTPTTVPDPTRPSPPGTTTPTPPAQNTRPTLRLNEDHVFQGEVVTDPVSGRTRAEGVHHYGIIENNYAPSVPPANRQMQVESYRPTGKEKSALPEGWTMVDHPLPDGTTVRAAQLPDGTIRVRVRLRSGTNTDGTPIFTDPKTTTFFPRAWTERQISASILETATSGTSTGPNRAGTVMHERTVDGVNIVTFTQADGTVNGFPAIRGSITLRDN